MLVQLAWKGTPALVQKLTLGGMPTQPFQPRGRFHKLFCTMRPTFEKLFRSVERTLRRAPNFNINSCWLKLSESCSLSIIWVKFRLIFHCYTLVFTRDFSAPLGSIRLDYLRFSKSLAVDFVPYLPQNIFPNDVLGSKCNIQNSKEVSLAKFSFCNV